MKFIFADSLDMVDPGYDMVADRLSPGRKPYWDDVYPHEILGYAPYDGILVSRGIVGDHRVPGKYTQSQAQRFRREGARRFLRLDRPEFQDLEIFGDCGAFTYVNEAEPPYSPEEMVGFYDDCGFTHGCSVDHIIFDFDENLEGLDGGTEEARRRFEITLQNASQFRAAAERTSNRFTPMGAVQGWSPGSMAVAAQRLVAMGYQYLAIGGMVPLKSAQIRACLRAIRGAIPPEIRIHVLGFAKADDISTFIPFNINSFDTTSPLIRAFKDERQNYYLPTLTGDRLEYFTAIRVPQSIENARLQRLVKRGVFRAEDLTEMEGRALGNLRAFDDGQAGLEETLEAVMTYNAILVHERPLEDVESSPKLKALELRYRHTLMRKPWRACGCSICQAAKIDVVIFRASNRNKRRGIHNLHAYRALVNGVTRGKAL
ncbi:tRNA-guanine transglycosylase DpdA [Prosthecomicrobium sp. N25]|uniref:tRNA-guanine transglycosylase DpdA n=1 Tax=Prosthecomicrobium sp. N25 TaxID=3129254 RepID=UPI003077D852